MKEGDKMQELPEFLEILQNKDPEYANNIVENFSKNLQDGELSAKTKIFIMLALDAGNSDIEGVKNLSKMAKEFGATEEELIEVIEVIGLTCGFQGLATAIEALK